MKIRLIHVIAALSLAGVLGFGGVSLASAQDTTSSTSTTTVQDDSTTTTPDGSSDTTPDDSTKSDENCPNMGGSGSSTDSSNSGATTSAFRTAGVSRHV